MPADSEFAEGRSTFSLRCDCLLTPPLAEGRAATFSGFNLLNNGDGLKSFSDSRHAIHVVPALVEHHAAGGLPSFIESSFATKREYEAWVERAIAPSGRAVTATAELTSGWCMVGACGPPSLASLSPLAGLISVARPRC